MYTWGLQFYTLKHSVRFKLRKIAFGKTIGFYLWNGPFFEQMLSKLAKNGPRHIFLINQCVESKNAALSANSELAQPAF